MRIVYNNIIPFKGFAAINLFGIIFVRSGVKIEDHIINHEAIHSAQMKEMGYISFYVIYIIEWIYRLFQNKFDNHKAYMSISFEKEAYEHERDFNYLENRKTFAMWYH